MQNIFITSPNVRSERWLAAFPKASIIVDDGSVNLVKMVFPKDCALWILLQGDWKACLENALNQGVKVIAMTLVEDVAQAQSLIGQGANGYIHALAAPKVLTQVGSVVASGGAWVGVELLRKLVVNIPDVNEDKSKRLSVLTDRQNAVAVCVAQGKSNKEIARELKITERTVKAHISSCFSKLEIRDRIQLALVMKS